MKSTGRIYRFAFSSVLLAFVLMSVLISTQSAQGRTAGSDMGNMALNKPAFSSSNRYKDILPARAVDGNYGSDWQSGTASGGQWLQVDLGEPKRIRTVVIYWRDFNSGVDRSFLIQTSNKPPFMKTVYTGLAPLFGRQEIAISDTVLWRWIRVRVPVGNPGFELYEFEVYDLGPFSPTSTNTPVHVP